MDNEVYLILNGEECFIGTVAELLDPENGNTNLHQAIRDIVDELVFSNDSKDYATCVIELR
jgi:hypothetical protein